jgi:hypothetical protein
MILEHCPVGGLSEWLFRKCERGNRFLLENSRSTDATAVCVVGKGYREQDNGDILYPDRYAMFVVHSRKAVRYKL